MIELKRYQRDALEPLRMFLSRCADGVKPEEAFALVQAETGALPQEYRPNVEGLSPKMPYVCLRVPTGGGKTLMACHAAGIAVKDLMRADRGVILWLVTSTAILDQTADALRDARHPYRRALEAACGAVEVMTIDEALRLSRAAADGATIVIVSTIQAFKADDTTGRRVYAQNENFGEHLLNLPADLAAGLEKGADGRPKPSLVNALKLRRPVVIVDEAHNVRSDLSFAALAAVNPSCVIEFTATPAKDRNPSNVLHQVSAAELKAADMAKLPVRVFTRQTSQGEELLAEAVALRRDLENCAAVERQKTGEYLRPILLIQAERVDTCEELRGKLTREYGFTAAEVKISSGPLRELDGLDLSSPDCPVRAVITVQHLREGWDCPFAYVLCSLRLTRSEVALEQMVGRVLRLPKARAKTQAALNSAYVFSVSPTIGEVLEELRAALVANGFTPAEAGRSLLPSPQAGLPLSMNPRTVALPVADLDAVAAAAQTTALGGKARIDAATGDVTIFVPLAESEIESLQACARSEGAKESIRALAAAVKAADVLAGGTGETRQPSPWERGEEFSVPLLGVREASGVLEFDPTCLLEHPWRLSEKDASLAGYDPRRRVGGSAAMLDIGAQGKVTYSAVGDREAEDYVATLHQQVLALGADEEWTQEKLVAWVDRSFDHPDIPASEAAAFIGNAVRGLLAEGATIDELGRDRFRLREAVEKRMREHREAEHAKAFQQYLLPGSALVVDDACAVDFRASIYEPSWLYDGDFRFKKHYFGEKPGELRALRASGRATEESLCAQYIDGLDEVEFWIRNLPRKPSSFRLLTPDGWFFPDFVCRLKDGRTLVVEYKGSYLWEGAQRKRDVGAVWASRSGGRCLFLMPTDGDYASIGALVRR